MIILDVLGAAFGLGFLCLVTHVGLFFICKPKSPRGRRVFALALLGSAATFVVVGTWLVQCRSLVANWRCDLSALEPHVAGWDAIAREAVENRRWNQRPIDGPMVVIAGESPTLHELCRDLPGAIAAASPDNARYVCRLTESFDFRFEYDATTRKGEPVHAFARVWEVDIVDIQTAEVVGHLTCYAEPPEVVGTWDLEEEDFVTDSKGRYGVAGQGVEHELYWALCQLVGYDPRLPWRFRWPGG